MNELITKQFYEYLDKFLMELSKSSKKLKKVIDEKYTEINEDKYINTIKKNIYVHKTHFLGKEEELDAFFNNNSIELLDDINISNIWKKSDKDNKNAIIQYIKVFVFMFETSNNNEDLSGGSGEEGCVQNNIDENIDEDENENEKEVDPMFEEMLKKSLLNDNENMKSLYENLNKEDNSIVGLAHSIANELKNDSQGGLENMMDMFKGGQGLNNLVNKITSKLDGKMKSGELDQSQLLNDAQKMMSNNSNLFGNMFNNLNKTQNSNKSQTSNESQNNNLTKTQINECCNEVNEESQKNVRKSKSKKPKKPKNP